MQIKCYRSRFHGMKSIGIPFGELLPVPVEKEEFGTTHYITDGRREYQITTHDRGNAGQYTPEFYQVVFRIVGDDADDSRERISASKTNEHKITEYQTVAYPDGENINGKFSLVLTPDHDNPLVYDESADLWYQRTEFDDKGRPCNNPNSLVDSINTAGVFSVELKENDVSTSESVKVEVAPSLLKIEDYQHMLDRLLSIHERLVVHAGKAVGIGSRSSQADIVPGTPAWDAELWNRLKPEILEIMKIPATLQEKNYVKMPVRKLQRFDNRVLRSYVRTGGVQADGVEYVDSYNIEENRVIKKLLQKMANGIFATKEEEILSDEEIEEKIKQEMSNAYGSNEPYHWCHSEIAKQNLCHSQNVILQCDETRRKKVVLDVNLDKVQSRNTPRKPHIEFQEKIGKFCIKTFVDTQKKDKDDGQFYWNDFHLQPFRTEEYTCCVSLTTDSVDVALSILCILSKIFDGTEKQLRGKKVTIESDGITKDEKRVNLYGKHLMIIKTIEGVRSISLSDEQPAIEQKITNFYDFYKRLMGSNVLKYMRKPTEMEWVEFIEDRKNYYRKENQRANEINASLAARNEIKGALNHPWFEAIAIAKRTTLRQTPLFIFNRHYHAIYNMLNEMTQYHPLLTSDFDENLFGVHETAKIYEYWVFYEILNRFLNLNFTFSHNRDDAGRTLQELFNSYVHNSNVPEGFAVCMSRKIGLLNNLGEPSGKYEDIEIMIGFNCVIGDAHAPVEKAYNKYLTPDYFIRVTRKDGYHWYFLDAKYENYSEDMLYKRAEKGQRKNSVADVCYDKYIMKMQQKDYLAQFADYHSKLHPEYWNSSLLHKNTIEGAYLVVAKCAGENVEVSERDSLCGTNGRQISEDKPYHRYGSIVLRPGKEDELTSLLEMIFEYNEGVKQIEVGTARSKTYENGRTTRPDVFFNEESPATKIHNDCQIELLPASLQACWDSTFDDKHVVNVQPQVTKSGKHKLYFMCSCSAHRYENYCIEPKCRHEIIKHNLGNYHFRDKANKTSASDRWNYHCPWCGKAIDPQDDTDERFADLQRPT